MRNPESSPLLARNRLARAASPYLRQHARNPVHWQEWNAATLAEAARLDRPLLVSVGYATCHWCHVMAADAFSDPDTAALLNRLFACVKVDRDQRPDIDRYLMDFLVAASGQGGWPLNAFLSPRLEPIFALTFAPARARGGQPAFADIARQVHAYYRAGARPEPFTPEAAPPGPVPEDGLVAHLAAGYDRDAGGFGRGQKFPPHAALLFLLHADAGPAARAMTLGTLDAMRRGGLHDHLQGGLFRYCVDRAWTVPHFEKMLYDQALGLWTYALAHKVHGRPCDRAMAEGLAACLDQTFRRDGFFLAAHDADTRHVEGGTYTWTRAELEAALTPDAFRRLDAAYDLAPRDALDGRLHLARRTDEPLPDIERTLLARRRQRPQPEPDDTILCGQNALAAMALVNAGRCLQRPDLGRAAAALTRRLLDTFWDGRALAHALGSGRLQRDAFLFDAAALLGAVALLREDAADWDTPLHRLADYVRTFREGETWIEARAADFRPVPASWHDQPMPSGPALAEYGLARAALWARRPLAPAVYRQPFAADFYNVAALLRNGLFHVVTTPAPPDWSRLPAATVRLEGAPPSDCYRGACRPLAPT